MSCKQTEVPVVPDGLLPSREGADEAPRSAPDRRHEVLDVRTRADTTVQAVLEGADDQWVWVRVGQSRVPLRVLRQQGTTAFVLPSGHIVAPAVGPAGPLTEVVVAGRSVYVSRRRVGSTAPALPDAEAGRVAARMPGRVVRVLAAPGDRVTRGQPLLVLEAMKMEDEVRAPRDGVVAEVRVAEGDRVERDAELVVLD